MFLKLETLTKSRAKPCTNGVLNKRSLLGTKGHERDKSSGNLRLRKPDYHCVICCQACQFKAGYMVNDLNNNKLILEIMYYRGKFT